MIHRLIQSTSRVFSGTLNDEIASSLSELQRQLIQSELAAFELESRILGIRGKIDYLRELQDNQIKRDMQA